MGVFDGFMNLLQLNDDDDDDDEINRGYSEQAAPSRRSSVAESARQSDQASENVTNIKRTKDAAATPRPVASRPLAARKKEGGSAMEVCVIKPQSIEDGREITDTLLAGRPVFLNMEGLDLEMAQRIVDYSCGSVYAMKGNLKKVSKQIYLLTPQSVEISGDIAELLDVYQTGGIKTDF